MIEMSGVCIHGLLNLITFFVHRSKERNKVANFEHIQKNTFSFFLFTIKRNTGIFLSSSPPKMGCCRPSSRSTSSPPKPPVPTTAVATTRKEETILKIPGVSVHLLLEEPEQYVKLDEGDLSILRVIDEDLVLVTIIKVGTDVQWPLTRDEPVVKVDELSYIFSLPDKDGGSFLNYGVSIHHSVHDDGCLDKFLKENSCFSIATAIDRSKPKNTGDWAKYVMRIGDYNKVLQKAVDGGTGQVVKGIFACSDVYSNQLMKGAKLIQPKSDVGRDNSVTKNYKDGKNGNILNKSLKR